MAEVSIRTYISDSVSVILVLTTAMTFLNSTCRCHLFNSLNCDISNNGYIKSASIVRGISSSNTNSRIVNVNSCRL